MIPDDVAAAAAEAQRRIEDDRRHWQLFTQGPLEPYLQAMDDAIADILCVPRRDRRDPYAEWSDTPEPATLGPVRVIRPGTLEHWHVTTRVRHVLGPVDPCRFPGVAPKITTMQ